jgi:hypothetical protein
VSSALTDALFSMFSLVGVGGFPRNVPLLALWKALVIISATRLSSRARAVVIGFTHSRPPLRRAYRFDSRRVPNLQCLFPLLSPVLGYEVFVPSANQIKSEVFVALACPSLIDSRRPARNDPCRRLEARRPPRRSLQGRETQQPRSAYL